ncbi:acyltransferase [Novosphingobium sp. TH158]|uniref:acyltransferase family protein n=1 Tax=Novosphingobium sp. TH158 TaxID=2067455 RepID=UPI000C79BCBF|nr:acyltransferase [Novosphingobium sp. TH158]PLK25911.1 hypothetical protein C0V78_02630 [Novosphingobium sp. TH158]
MLLTASALGFAAALLVAWGLLRAGFPMPDGGGRAQSVDGLRGFLACAVAIHHLIIWFGAISLGRGWQAPEMPLLNQFGAGSVALFFMITAWLLYPKIEKGLGARDWVQLYVGRAFRILPMVALAIAVVILLAWLKSGTALTAEQVPGLFLWLFGLKLPAIGGVSDAARINASVFWYLGQEWFFYVVILPLLYVAVRLWMRLARPGWLILLLLVASWAVSIIWPLRGEDYFVARSPWAFRLFLPVLLAGMAIAAVLRSGLLDRLIASPLFAWASLALFAATVWFCQFPYGWSLPGFLPFMLCLASGRHYGALLSARPVLLLGNLSFSIYVMHPELLYALFGFDTALRSAMGGMSALVTVPAVMVAVVLLAALVHLLAERPMIALGNRVRKAIQRA